MFNFFVHVFNCIAGHDAHDLVLNTQNKLINLYIYLITHRKKKSKNQKRKKKKRNRIK